MVELFSYQKVAMNLILNFKKMRLEVVDVSVGFRWLQVSI